MDKTCAFVAQPRVWLLLTREASGLPGGGGCVHTGDMPTLAKEAHWSYHTPAPGTILNFLCVAGSITPITDGETVTTTPGTWLSNSDSRRDPFRSAIATYS